MMGKTFRPIEIFLLLSTILYTHYRIFLFVHCQTSVAIRLLLYVKEFTPLNQIIPRNLALWACFYIQLLSIQMVHWVDYVAWLKNPILKGFWSIHFAKVRGVRQIRSVYQRHDPIRFLLLLQPVITAPCYLRRHASNLTPF